MIKSLKEVASGDIILTRNEEIVSKVIRFFGKMQTGDAQYSHAAAGLEDYLCIEALWRTRINSLEKYENSALEIWRLPLSKLERGDFRRGMLQIAGGDYGLTKIPLFALDAVATKVSKLWGNNKPVFWFTEKLGVFNIPVCSQLVCYGLEKFAYYRLQDADHNPVSWKVISPDYLQDLLHHPHNRAELIYKQEAT